MSSPIAKPSRDDPMVRAASEWIGGPYGVHGQRARSSWWTPLRIALAVASVVFTFGFVLDQPCHDDGWSSRLDEGTWTAMCYSDVAFAYRESGLAEDGLAYRDFAFDYPVLTGAVMEVSAAAARGVQRTVDSGADTIVESVRFFEITSLLLGLAALVVVISAARTVPRRPWDALIVAASPLLLLSATINWDLLAVALTSIAMLAWAKQRPVVAGISLGLAMSAQLYPALLLVALLLVALRDESRRAALRAFVLTSIAAAMTWSAVNLPFALWAPAGWRTYFTAYAERDLDIGSTWYALQLLQKEAIPIDANALLVMGGILIVALLTALALLAPEQPRLAQLAFLAVAGFVLINKAWAPQHALWLLPLAVLARPRWRDILVWQLAEVVYFVVVWRYVGGLFVTDIAIPTEYSAFATVLRAVALLWLAGLVVRDVLRPEQDPVRPYLEPIRQRKDDGLVASA